MSDYKKLRVWRQAHALALDAHRAAIRIRGNEYGPFRSQIIRSAMSIPANIVEGREQKTSAGFARYLRISLSSASELEYHLIAARQIGKMSKSEFVSLRSQVVAVRMMLHGLIKRLETNERDLEDPNHAPTLAESGERKADSGQHGSMAVLSCS